MANKKAGNRTAASQAKARERARRKARSAGPSLAESAYATPVEPEEALEETPKDAPTEAPVSVAETPGEAAPTRAVATAERRRAPTVVSQRRANQASAMVPAGGLRRELAMIGSITAIVGAALAFLKLATDLGA